MKKLSRADIRGPKLYAAIRDDMRARVIAIKKLRRVAVGPQVSLVFENRATMIFQVEEMCRAEGLSDPEKIQQEIDVYNRVLPDAGQLGATLLIELTDEKALADGLERLLGLHDHVWLILGGARCKAHFDPGQFDEDRLAAVQYLRFTLAPAEQALLRQEGTALAVVIDHPHYRNEARLSEATRAELARDLD
jgi:hypothetical protein